jgi:hypothetical protein
LIMGFIPIVERIFYRIWILKNEGAVLAK